jgi:hypothetical protein
MQRTKIFVHGKPTAQSLARLCGQHAVVKTGHHLPGIGLLVQVDADATGQTIVEKTLGMKCDWRRNENKNTQYSR